MNDAESIIHELKLEPHPEGGHFVESFKTKEISIIYYLLKKNEKSHWHRLSKNETLQFCFLRILFLNFLISKILKL